MSGPEYPPPSYTGSAGEASAWVRSAGTPAELPRSGGSAAHYLATGQTAVEGGQQAAAIEQGAPPVGQPTAEREAQPAERPDQQA